MARSDRRIRIAGVLAALLLLGACSSGGDDDTAVDADDAGDVLTDDGAAEAEDADETGSQQDAETTDSTATGGGDDPDAPAPTDAAAPATTDAQPAPSTSAPAPAEGGEKPATPLVPESGTYTFERTAKSEEGTETNTTDVGVERLSGDDRGGQVRVTLESEQGTLTNDTLMSADGSTLVQSSIIESPLGEITCDWDPDWLIVGALAEGSTWSYASGCSDNKGTLAVEVSTSGDAKVLGFETITVAGESVVAWVIESTTVTNFTVKSPTLNGTGSSESVSRTWIDPGRGMQVRDTTTTTSSGDFGAGTTESTLEFLSFTAA